MKKLVFAILILAGCAVHRPVLRETPQFSLQNVGLLTYMVEFPRDKPMEFFRVRSRNGFGEVSDWATCGPGLTRPPSPGCIGIMWDFPSLELAAISGFEVWSSPNLADWAIRTNLPSSP